MKLADVACSVLRLIGRLVTFISPGSPAPFGVNRPGVTYWGVGWPVDLHVDS